MQRRYRKRAASLRHREAPGSAQRLCPFISIYGFSVSDLAEGGAGIRAVEINPVIAAREGGAVGLPVHLGPQEYP